MCTRIPDTQDIEPQHRANRFSDAAGAIPHTLATLPAQFAILTWLLKPLTGSQVAVDVSASELAQFTPQNNMMVYLLLLVMLLGASAFLIHRLRRTLRNLKNPPLPAVVLERTIELKRFRRMLSKAEHMANAGSWSYESESGRFIWSDELFRIFGFEPTEVAPDKEIRLNLVHPEDRKMFIDHELKSISTGQPYTIKMRVARPDGSYRVIQHRVEPECNSSGKVIRRIGTVIDITHQVANEKTFRLMFDQTPYPFMIVNRQGIVECNPATSELCGRTAEEMPEHHLSDYSPEYQPDGQLSDKKAKEIVNLAYKNGFHQSEWMLKNSDGIDILAEINLSTFRSGSETNLMVVIHDLRVRSQQ